MITTVTTTTELIHMACVLREHQRKLHALAEDETLIPLWAGNPGSRYRALQLESLLRECSDLAVKLAARLTGGPA